MRAVNVRAFVGHRQGSLITDGETLQSRDFVDDEGFFGRDVGKVSFHEGGYLMSRIAQSPEKSVRSAAEVQNLWGWKEIGKGGEMEQELDPTKRNRRTD